MKKGLALLRSIGLVAALALVLPGAGMAQQVKPRTPYWASIDQEPARARVGPGLDYRIIWVYQRRNLPVKVVKVHESWRQVEDPDGAQSWMHVRLLSAQRTAMVRGDRPVPMRDRPAPGGRLKWQLAPGVVGKLGGCTDGYCELDVNGRSGFVDAASLWGTAPPGAEGKPG